MGCSLQVVHAVYMLRPDSQLPAGFEAGRPASFEAGCSFYIICIINAVAMKVHVLVCGSHNNVN